MRIWMNGGEVPEHRETLARLGVGRVAFNLAPIVQQRNGNAGDRDELDPFETLFYSSQADVDPEAMTQVVTAYSDSESLVLDMASDDLPMVPLWDGRDLEDLMDDAVTYGMVAVEEAHALDVDNQRKLTMFIRRNPHVRIFCITSKAKVLALPFITDAIVTGWLHASKYREFQMWDGHKVLRAPRTDRHKLIDKHRVQIQNLGEDPDAIKDEDMAASIALAVKSWLQYERVVTNLAPIDPVEGVLTDPESLAIEVEEPAHRDPILLPILTEPDGKYGEDEDGNPIPRLGVRQDSLRKCDMCFVNQVCPGFKKGASCAYSIPITVTNKAEREAVNQMLLDIQLQRVLEQRFFEQLQGEGASKDTSAEMDRYVRMHEGVERAKQTRAELTISSTNGGGGVLSELFGSKVGTANRELPPAVPSDQLIEDGLVVDP